MIGSWYLIPTGRASRCPIRKRLRRRSCRQPLRRCSPRRSPSPVAALGRWRDKCSAGSHKQLREQTCLRESLEV